MKADVNTSLNQPDRNPTATAPSLAEIRVIFKLDPRLTKGVYMGERWVSPPVYTLVQEGKEATVEAKALGLDAGGRPMAISPKWMPEDADMLEVTPSQGNAVKIVVRRAGQSILKVGMPGLARTLVVKARSEGDAVQVDISQ